MEEAGEAEEGRDLGPEDLGPEDLGPEDEDVRYGSRGRQVHGGAQGVCEKGGQDKRQAGQAVGHGVTQQGTLLCGARTAGPHAALHAHAAPA